VVTCSGTWYVYDPADCSYRDRASLEGFRKLIERATAYVGVHARFVCMTRRVMDLIRDFARADPRLVLDAELSEKGRVAWNNGVYDLRTPTLLPFSPNIVIFYKLGPRLPENRRGPAQGEGGCRRGPRAHSEPVVGR
jgi:hypothetical protein